MSKVSRRASEDRDWDDHERRIRNLETSQRAGYTTVVGDLRLAPGSKLSASAPDGTTLFYVGEVDYGPPWGLNPVVQIRRADGTTAFLIGGADETNQYFALSDQQENIIVSDDAISGQGLARPWLPIPWRDEANVTTVATGFVTACSAVIYKQHPKVQIEIEVDSSTTTSEVQIIVAAGGGSTTPWGPVSYTTGSSRNRVTLPVLDLPGEFNDRIWLQLQHRSTTVGPTVGAWFASIWERQS
jgi:hypothetical protein